MKQMTAKSLTLPIASEADGQFGCKFQGKSIWNYIEGFMFLYHR